MDLASGLRSWRAGEVNYHRGQECGEAGADLLQVNELIIGMYVCEKVIGRQSGNNGHKKTNREGLHSRHMRKGKPTMIQTLILLYTDFIRFMKTQLYQFHSSS